MLPSDEHIFQGIHILGEMYGIEPELLDNVELLEKALREGIEESGASLCGIQTKKFEPQGVTILGLLSESHASIHTYPDRGALFFDAFTCGTRCQPQKIAEALSKVLNPSRTNLQSVVRGEDSSSREPLEFNSTALSESGFTENSGVCS